MYFYPRSPCGERRAGCGHVAGGHQISIHALLAESDSKIPPPGSRSRIFLSTLSLRRATALEGVVTLQQYDFYPRSPCGERHVPFTVADLGKRFLSTLSLRRATKASSTPFSDDPISIHALLAESDKSPANSGPCIRYFYPRSPCGERRGRWSTLPIDTAISIHALLAESDTSILHKILADWDFYPRSPCGERRQAMSPASIPIGFLSTLSLRRATQIKQTCRAKISISIHALLAESDLIRYRINAK